jgi:penicillin-binding protein 2
VQGFYYKKLSDSNRIRTYVLHAPRGVIFDRNATPLVYNTPGFRQLVKGKTKLLSREKALELLAKGDTSIEVDALRQYPFKDSLAHVIGYIGQITQQELEKDPTGKYLVGDLIGEMGVEQQYEDKLVGTNGKKLVEVDSNGKEVPNSWPNRSSSRTRYYAYYR